MARSTPSAIESALEAARPALPVGVAFSGGADSSCLLVAAARRWPGQVEALHVHHGLQVAADAFEARCRATCASLEVPLQVAHVDARHAPGESPEEAARRARYRALADLARGRGLRTVLLAQHADDQAETLLLALSRGAGVPGLAAMPARFEREGIAFERPLLGIPGSAIRRWVADEGIAFVDDPTNADTARTRNRIRHELLPALERAFPEFRETFARSSRHAAQAAELLDELARSDLAGCGGEPVLDALHGLSRPRQANLLRHWLRVVHGTSASTAQLDELLDQVAACTTARHRIRLRVGRGVVEREGARLRYSGD